jgi:hypothetical protein
MMNSVVGEAAALGDALGDQARRQQQQQPPSTTLPTTSLPLLGGTSSSRQHITNARNQQGPPNKTNINKNRESLTQLLQATDFTLQDMRIAAPPKNQLFLDAQASSGTTSFSYTLRVELQTTLMKVQQQQQKQTGLVFGPTDVRFETGALSNNPWLQNILPDVYLPVGPGVALLLPQSHHDVKVRTLPLESSSTDKEPQSTTMTMGIELCGRQSFFDHQAVDGGDSSSLTLWG